ncbi:MAG: DUF2889 domain-containing protein [Candidatus Lambdaproteobacteria bacterium]|nr:DUF2889 domain-containing protein [Candidatus Lambdaproteobacteria bacterium]
MPLSSPENRKLVHNRDIQLRGYKREDGLWDIEAHLLDTKTYDSYNPWGGMKKKGTPIHDMWLRVTFDSHHVVQDVEAVTDHSPYALCGGGNVNFKRLIGLHVGKGWNTRVRQLLDGAASCTHMRELLAQLATIAYQTIRGYTRDLPPDRAEAARASVRGPKLNSCWAFRSESELIQQFMPAHYTGPGSDAAPPEAGRNNGNNGNNGGASHADPLVSAQPARRPADSP